MSAFNNHCISQTPIPRMQNNLMISPPSHGNYSSNQGPVPREQDSLVPVFPNHKYNSGKNQRPFYQEEDSLLSTSHNKINSKIQEAFHREEPDIQNYNVQDYDPRDYFASSYSLSTRAENTASGKPSFAQSKKDSPSYRGKNHFTSTVGGNSSSGPDYYRPSTKTPMSMRDLSSDQPQSRFQTSDSFDLIAARSYNDNSYPTTNQYEALDSQFDNNSNNNPTSLSERNNYDGDHKMISTSEKQEDKMGYSRSVPKKVIQKYPEDGFFNKGKNKSGRTSANTSLCGKSNTDTLITDYFEKQQKTIAENLQSSFGSTEKDSYSLCDNNNKVPSFQRSNSKVTIDNNEFGMNFNITGESRHQSSPFPIAKKRHNQQPQQPDTIQQQQHSSSFTSEPTGNSRVNEYDLNHSISKGSFVNESSSFTTANQNHQQRRPDIEYTNNTTNDNVYNPYNGIVSNSFGNRFQTTSTLIKTVNQQVQNHRLDRSCDRDVYDPKLMPIINKSSLFSNNESQLSSRDDQTNKRLTGNHDDLNLIEAPDDDDFNDILTTSFNTRSSFKTSKEQQVRKTAESRASHFKDPTLNKERSYEDAISMKNNGVQAINHDYKSNESSKNQSVDSQGIHNVSTSLNNKNRNGSNTINDYEDILTASFNMRKKSNHQPTISNNNNHISTGSSRNQSDPFAFNNIPTISKDQDANSSIDDFDEILATSFLTRNNSNQLQRISHNFSGNNSKNQPREREPLISYNVPSFHSDSEDSDNVDDLPQAFLSSKPFPVSLSAPKVDNGLENGETVNPLSYKKDLRQSDIQRNTQNLASVSDMNLSSDKMDSMRLRVYDDDDVDSYLLTGDKEQNQRIFDALEDKDDTPMGNSNLVEKENISSNTSKDQDVEDVKEANVEKIENKIKLNADLGKISSTAYNNEKEKKIYRQIEGNILSTTTWHQSTSNVLLSKSSTKYQSATNTGKIDEHNFKSPAERMNLLSGRFFKTKNAFCLGSLPNINQSAAKSMKNQNEQAVSNPSASGTQSVNEKDPRSVFNTSSSNSVFNEKHHSSLGSLSNINHMVRASSMKSPYNQDFDSGELSATKKSPLDPREFSPLSKQQSSIRRTLSTIDLTEKKLPCYAKNLSGYAKKLPSYADENQSSYDKNLSGYDKKLVNFGSKQTRESINQIIHNPLAVTTSVSSGIPNSKENVTFKKESTGTLTNNNNKKTPNYDFLISSLKESYQKRQQLSQQQTSDTLPSSSTLLNPDKEDSIKRLSSSDVDKTTTLIKDQNAKNKINNNNDYEDVVAASFRMRRKGNQQPTIDKNNSHYKSTELPKNQSPKPHNESESETKSIDDNSDFKSTRLPKNQSSNPNIAYNESEKEAMFSIQPSNIHVTMSSKNTSIVTDIKDSTTASTTLMENHQDSLLTHTVPNLGVEKGGGNQTLKDDISASSCFKESGDNPSSNPSINSSNSRAFKDHELAVSSDHVNNENLESRMDSDSVSLKKHFNWINTKLRDKDQDEEQHFEKLMPDKGTFFGLFGSAILVS